MSRRPGGHDERPKRQSQATRPPAGRGRGSRGDCTRRSSTACGCSAARSRCPAAPVVYQPKIVIVGQGRKRAYLGDEVTPTTRSTISSCRCRCRPSARRTRAPRSPLLIVAIDVEPTMLGEMILEMDEPSPPVGPTPRGISTTPMSEELGGAVIRLLECLKSSARQPHPRPPDGPRNRLSRAPWRARRGAPRPGRPGRPFRPHRPGLEVHPRRVRQAAQRRGVARRAGMSVPVFHHHFKLVTASSPLQYLKRIRLDRARRLMAQTATTRAPPRGRSATRARRSSAGSSSGSSA